MQDSVVVKDILVLFTWHIYVPSEVSLKGACKKKSERRQILIFWYSYIYNQETKKGLIVWNLVQP